MLHETTLEELTRYGYSPLQEALVTAAWPSLSVESKLQAIERILHSGFSLWLAQLALTDEHVIVRYWCARHSRFAWLPLPGQKDSGQLAHGEPSERELTRGVREDVAELVRACERSISEIRFSGLESRSQLSRLVAIRNLRRPHLFPLVEWLVDMVATGAVSDFDLRDIADEFFRHPFVRQCYLAGDEAFHALRGNDILAFRDQEALSKGWALVAGCGEYLRYVLATNLPTALGHERISVDDLAKLPPKAIQVVLCHDETEWAVNELRERIEACPNEFDETVVSTVKWLREDAEERRLSPRFSPLTPEQKSHNELVKEYEQQGKKLDALQNQLVELQRFVGEQFSTLANAVQQRRGLFG